MPPIGFSVSQVSVAATCPRILYFDAVQTRNNPTARPSVTRIWRPSDESTAAGALFHATVDRFHRDHRRLFALPELATITAPDGDRLGRLLFQTVYWECVDRETLADKDGEQQQAFLGVLQRYTQEVADVLAYHLRRGQRLVDAIDDLFADTRRRVDVTFPVGPAGEPVRVTGILDYVFHDRRTGGDRILDYKLLPPYSSDLFQVGIYALMHDVQHQTRPAAGVLYLHPERALHELPWEKVTASRPTVYNLLASMREWVAYDEATNTGRKPPGNAEACSRCRWRHECVTRLGPVNEGTRADHWTAETVAPVRPEVRLPEADPDAETVISDPVPPPTAALPSGLWVGRITAAKGKRVELPSAVLPTHTAVVGAAGSGKTWLAKVVAEEAALAGVAVLAIDPQGDLVQFLRPHDSAKQPAAERERTAQFFDSTQVRILTPGTDHGTRVSLSPLKLPGTSATSAEDVEDLLGTAAAHLVTMAKATGEIEAQQTFVLQVLRALVRLGREPGLSDIAAALRMPDAVGIDDPDQFVRRADRERLARQLNTLEHGPSARLFTGGRPLALDWIAQPTTPGRVPVNVLYLNALADDAQKQSVVAAVAIEVYRWMVASGGSAGKPRLLFYLDEARDFIPAGTVQSPAKRPLMRLFAQGRKYGVACLICTQSPRSVDYNVFGNCSTKLIGRLESAQDVERIRDWFSPQGPPPAWVAGRVGAAPGTFVGRWPGMPTDLDGQAFQSRVLLTSHEGAWSPERVATESRS